MTYGDGLSNVNLNKLLEFHKKHGKLATITAVQAIPRFGLIELDNDKVRGIMGLCYPAISVSGGGKVECNFSQSFTHDPKDIGLFGYDGIIPARDVL